ncbi:MAG: hypothetical protein PUE12_05950 [Oscillospiraceae bacterium]|nr:hypothetical protein [Oscillospiraceae bacterium]
MPITLIKNTKDNAMHGSDNDRYTGCRLKMQNGNWYTREGELKDITDLTCERCKEVFATKMIRESNREESRIAKEEKKRFQREKKLGKIKEATYEEYILNRESEASARRDSHKADDTSSSLKMLRDMVPESQVQQPQQEVQPQSMFNPYAQQQQQVVPPQNIFDPYAQQQQQDIASVNLSESVQNIPEMNENQQESTPVADDGPVPSYQEYVRGGGDSVTSSPAKSSSPAANDDFLAQFMINKTPEPVQETVTPSVTADNILNSTDDILSQFNIGAQKAENFTGSAQPQGVKADASSFYSDNIPVVGAEYAGAASVNSATTEFGSLNIVEPPKDEFVVPDVPVYQPVENTFANANMVSQSSSLDDLEVPDVSSLKSVNEAPNYSLQFAELASADVHQAASFNNETDEIGLADIEPDYGFGQLTSETSPNYSNTTDESEDIMSEFTQVSSVPTMNSFESVIPVQPVVPTMNSFESVTPVQPVVPTMNSFESVTPVQPVVPTMNSFESVTPVQPVVPTMNSFESITPVQPEVSTMNSFGQQPVQNPYAAPQNNYTQQPYNNYNPYAAPQPNSFQMPTQQYNNNMQVQQPTAPVRKPPAPAVFEQGNTADSIEEALRQLGLDVATPEEKAQAEKEEIVPDFVSYVPSSSKVLHSAPPANNNLNSAPKRPISAREAKQLAKIDAKFKKDLISRGFNPNELKNQRRGK